MIAWFFAASVAKACGKHDEHEYEGVRVPGQGGFHAHEHEGEGSEDAVKQTQERDPAVSHKRICPECSWEPLSYVRLLREQCAGRVCVR